MSHEAQLKKLEAERERLQAELKTLSEAISTREACEDLIRHVERAAEPLAADHQKENPWAQTAKSSQCCCIQ